jgi:hypothetical protein
MLFNLKWNKTAETAEKPQINNPLSLDAVIAWLEKQPANQRYDYCDPENCMAAQYNQSIGRKYLAYRPIIAARRGYSNFDTMLEEIAQGSEGDTRKQNFGSALKRARKLQAKIK